MFGVSELSQNGPGWGLTALPEQPPGKQHHGGFQLSLELSSSLEAKKAERWRG